MSGALFIIGFPSETRCNHARSHHAACHPTSLRLASDHTATAFSAAPSGISPDSM